MITNETICCKSDCPKAATCERQKRYAETIGTQVEFSLLNPELTQVGTDGCDHFLSAEEVRIAFGFNKLYDSLPQGMSRGFRFDMPFTSESMYYRAKRGKFGLNPHMQKIIMQIFREHGAPEGVDFDRYETMTIYQSENK